MRRGGEAVQTNDWSSTLAEAILANGYSTVACAGRTIRPPASNIFSLRAESGSVVRSVIGRTSVPSARAVSRATDSTKASASRCGAT